MEPLKYLYVYLTDDCNLQCSHCWQDAPMAGGHRTTFLDFDRTKPFLDEARRLGLQAVNLSGGEPMLSPDFCDFINYFGEHGIQCAIETNGMLISGPRLDAIRRHRPLCAVSIDGFSPETHNRQRGRDDAFEQTVRGIERLEGSQIPFELVMSVSRVNLNELEPLLERVAKDWHACRIFKINIVSPQGRGENMRNQGLLLGTHDLIGMTKHVATFIGRYSFKVLLHVQPAFYSVGDLARGFGCGGHCGYQAALSVLSDGSVSICSLGKRAPEYIFGDVATIELERVWTTHPLLEQVHDGGHHLLKGICARCVFRRFCAGGCRAVALDYYGDFFAPFPMCQELFESGGFPATFIRPATPAEGDGSYTSAKCVARV